ncbi:LOW QUALITY PROTEIN: cytochrome P450 2W1-like [Discoglossus pictus]
MAIFSEGATILLLCTIVMMCVKHLFDLSRRKKYIFPPGPTPLPIIGNLHILDIKRQDFTFMKLAKQYGPVFTFHLGSNKAIILCGYEANKEALVTSGYEFGNRGPIPIADVFQHGQGVIFSNGDNWKATRRFTLSILRDLGMGKRPIEGRIIEELGFLCKLIETFQGNPFHQKIFTNAPPNITFGLLFGRRFDYGNPTFRRLVKLLDEFVVLAGSPAAQYYNFMPFLGHFIKEPQMSVKIIDEINIVLKKLCKEAKETIDENCWTTYTEAFMLKDQREVNTKENGKVFHDENLLASMFDLMLGGTETTSTTLQWGILCMMKYPHIQKKAQEEIENVIGLERPPTWDDQKILPYCLALVHEIQRFGNILQYLAHSTITDTHFRGFFIPKGTLVLPLFTSVLYDETQWETPREFNPNHFLDDNGKFVKKDAFYPFSKGRRVCAGESLARMELFIFFTGLLQKFTFTPPPGINKCDLDLNADVFFTLRPKYFNVCATPRQ